MQYIITQFYMVQLTLKDDIWYVFDSITPCVLVTQYDDIGNIYKCIFMKEKFCILIQLSLKGPIDNNTAIR